MRALLGDKVIAEADKDDLIYIEDHWYFPPSKVNQELLQKSSTPYYCPWKGKCQYFNVNSGSESCQDCAFSYPNPKKSAIKIVKNDFSDYVAFWQEVKVEDD